MTRTQIFSLAVSAVTDFLITAGTALSTAMLATGDKLPKAIWISAVVAGLVQASRGIKSALAPPPVGP